MTAIDERDKMPAAHHDLLNILRKHAGKSHAISMADLYERYTGKRIPRDSRRKPLVDVPTLSREMRKMIDDLRDVWGIPIMSSSSAGYWIVTDPAELGKVHHEFMSRGLKSLQTAARLKQISLVDAVQQLAFDLQNNASELREVMSKKRRKMAMDPQLGQLTLSPEAKLAVITRHMQELLEDPDKYADQVAALQRLFGPKLLPSSVQDAIEKQTAEVRTMAARTIEAATRLQAMVGQV